MMTKGERAELLSLVKKRERVMRARAEERSAALIAEFDVQSAKIYHWDDDEVWAKAKAQAEEAIEAAQEIIARQCRKMGIPAEFSPQLMLEWYGRGHNAVAERRAELRRAAKSKIDSLQKEALSKIEQMSLNAQIAIVTKGLESQVAKEFMNSFESVDKLMPPVVFADVQTLIEMKHKENRRSDYEMLN